MGLVHKQTVHTQLLESHHIVFSPLGLQLFQSGFQSLSGTLQLLDGKTLAATGLYLCNPLSDLVDLFMHRPILFNELVLSDKLFEHCAEIDEAARNRMELIVPELAKQYGVTEQLKAENQMEWVRQMNACKAQAEEVVKAELIYD